MFLRRWQPCCKHVNNVWVDFVKFIILCFFSYCTQYYYLGFWKIQLSSYRKRKKEVSIYPTYHIKPVQHGTHDRQTSQKILLFFLNSGSYTKKTYRYYYSGSYTIQCRYFEPSHKLLRIIENWYHIFLTCDYICYRLKIRCIKQLLTLKHVQVECILKGY